MNSSTIKEKLHVWSAGLKCDGYEGLFSLFSKAMIIIIAVVALVRSTMGSIIYAEIDSYALPVISLQYRGSIVVEQGDLIRAQQDFPSLYTGINTYDDLRLNKLVKITEDKWYPFYFPIYSLLCIPVKLVLQALRVPQEQTFAITNAILYLIALISVKRILRASEKTRFYIIALLCVTPVIFAYLPYVGAEVFVLSFLVYSLVAYENGNKYLCALFLSIAGMPNPTIMGMGIILVLRYMLDTYVLDRSIGLKRRIMKNWKDTVIYALCFVPCLIPFICSFILIKQANPTAGGINFSSELVNIMTYYFDINMGYMSFAPVIVVAFFVFAALSFIKKNISKPLMYLLFSAAVVASFSLMYHINCGMQFCARYVAWSYPILVFGVATNDSAIKSIKAKGGLIFCSLAVSAGIIFYNLPDSGGVNIHPFYLNDFSKLVLDNVPQLYNPNYTTFNCRVTHSDGAYVYNVPVWYKDSKNGEVRKLMYVANEESKDYILRNLKCEDDSEYLAERLDKYGNDGGIHYLNFPPSKTNAVTEKSLEEKYPISDVEEYVLVDSPLTLSGNDVLDVQTFEVPIESNSCYRIEAEFSANISDYAASVLFVDFYGGSAYDGGYQEISYLDPNAASASEHSFKNYIYSDSLISADIPPIVRVVAQSEYPVVLNRLSIVKVDIDLNSDITEENMLISSPVTIQNEDLNVLSFPVELEPNTMYKLDINLADDSELNDIPTFFVDFWGGSCYDNSTQEYDLVPSVTEGQREFSIFMDSGEVWSADTSTEVRLVAATNSPIIIESFSVTKMPWDRSWTIQSSNDNVPDILIFDLY